MTKKNKVRCKNGHFFDLNLRSTCPICGESACEEVSSKKPVSIRPSRVSHLDPVDKTEIMDETSISNQSMRGKIGDNIYELVSSVKTNPISQKSFDLSGSETAAPAFTPADSAESKDSAASESEAFSANSLSQQVNATGHTVISPLPKTTYLRQETEAQEFDPVSGWLVCIKGTYRGQSFACGYGRNPIGRNPSCRIQLPQDTSINRESHAIITYEPRNREFYVQPGNGNGLIYLNGAAVFSHQRIHANDHIEIGNAEFLFVPLCGENFTWET